jgi:hypothetical protein
MTPQLETAIAAIQTLSPTERQQLLQILQNDKIEDSQPELKALDKQFRQGLTLQQLRASQNPKTFNASNFKAFGAGIFPEEDSIEDFLAFLQQQRQAT